MKVKDVIDALQYFVSEVHEIAEFDVRLNTPEGPYGIERPAKIDFKQRAVWLQSFAPPVSLDRELAETLLGRKGMRLLERPRRSDPTKTTMEYAVVPPALPGHILNLEVFDWYPFWQEAYAHWLTDQAVKGEANDEPNASPFDFRNDRDWETDPDEFYEVERKLQEAGFVFARRLTSAFAQKVREGGYHYTGHEIEADFAIVPRVAPDGYLGSDKVRWFNSWQEAYADWRKGWGDTP